MSFLKKFNFNLNCDQPESFVACQVSVLEKFIADLSSIKFLFSGNVTNANRARIIWFIDGS